MKARLMKFIRNYGGLCFLVALTLWFAFRNYDIMNQRLIIFVNDVDHADGAKCNWPAGRQQFHITLNGATASVFISALRKHGSPFDMDVFVNPRGAYRMETDSIKFRLIYSDANQRDREIRLSPQLRPPILRRNKNGNVCSWHQNFQIAEDLSQLPEKSLRLIWSMDYRDASGELKQLRITVPLRKEEIATRISIVNLNRVALPERVCFVKSFF